ncbi:Na+/H+ antiporter NhaC family protein [Geosporobacter ferrireducens]|uniref:Na+/H+ antiporter NhaC-like C-terminal domain-containing protein n=1 Tax=Geosporobacter ferrireducens TaxID=1424294 RepID=A0A1D8GCC2_9FIRM|nr:Na+/H+ antiporter NhaC family protein [Geosporobacter ferrireducens]AOT68564.1 hypothetical protein Gferi_02510 [Geosporobacter ferrireducens]MTI54031.1 sodium:proton antiporter [Geosporobacter ferrireducens]
MEKIIIPLRQIYLLLSIMILLIAGCILFGIPLYYGLLIVIVFAVVICIRNGFHLPDLMDMIIGGVKECSSIFIIILLVGSLVAVWLASGIVPAMMYYGFNYIQKMNFLLACFLITMLTAIVMGTALGTVSTIGVALLGLGKGLLIPESLLMGAIISGAFVADKISPIAALVNLTAKTTEVPYKDSAKQGMLTLLPAIGIAGGIYFFLGRGYTAELDAVKLDTYQNTIREFFNISPLMLLLPMLVIVLAFMGVKIIKNMALGLLGGIIISVGYQRLEWTEIVRIILRGYKAVTSMEELNAIIKGGGVMPMIEAILIVLAAVALNSIFEGTNMIAPMINGFLIKIKSKNELIAKTGFLSILLTVLTCDQTVGILMPGKFLKQKYKEIGLPRAILARTIADTGVIIAPIIPWNVNAILITVITGVSAVQYAPYTVLCYGLPIITLLFGAYGFVGEGDHTDLEKATEIF